MIWLAILLLAAATLGPLLWTAWRAGTIRSRREAALDLHRAQLAEIDRDLADDRIAAAEHGAAKLEVQRRLLAEADCPEAPAERHGAAPLVAALVLVPAAALGLYMLGGHPELPAAPLAGRIAAASRDQALVDALRNSIGKLDPHSEQARQGELILGRAEASLGHMKAAAEAWQGALAIHFDPMVAAEAAEAETEATGRLTEASTALFRRALAEGPPDAPWRPMVERRLADIGR